MADQTTTQLNLCPNKVHYSPRGPGVQVLVKPLSSRTGNEGRDENIDGLYARGIFFDLIKGQFRTFLVHDAKGTPHINLLPEAFARRSRGDDLPDFFLLFSSKGIKSQYTGSFGSFVFHHIFNF